MSLITESKTIRDICAELHNVEYVTVDTEFLRDKFYYPKLCLVQIAWEGGSCAIDVLAKGLDLEPISALFADKKVMKVFHSARQDIEVILNIFGKVPIPLFDTQVAAMVCGFGDSVSYATLVEKISGEVIDKTLQFTDWSHRPLSERHINYSLKDVTFLRDVYKELKRLLEKNNRLSWLDDEMKHLTNLDNYKNDPEEAWKRIKTRANSRRFLGIVKELAKWRELKAMSLNIPRGFVLRDHVLLEIAAHTPTSLPALKSIREVGNTALSFGNEIISILKAVNSLAEDSLPDIKLTAGRPKKHDKALAELLKVLLKMKCNENNVAERIVACSEDIITISRDDNPEVPAMNGWRYDIFGKYAMALKSGKLALTVAEGNLRLLEI